LEPVFPHALQQASFSPARLGFDPTSVGSKAASSVWRAALFAADNRRTDRDQRNGPMTDAPEAATLDG
jgi:hypothetical protein